ncbi:MAG: hypothetical protein KIS66_16670 [Fimbriimonadaceae bacterium]|nr:hypothetical protein [Fimbriimonadaceae bacterium]
MEKFRPLAERIAGEVARKERLDRDEALSAAYVALCEGCDGWVRRGLSGDVAAYLESKIRGSCKSRTLDQVAPQPVRVPRYLRACGKLVESAARDITEATGRPPTEDELCAETGLTPERLRSIREACDSVSVPLTERDS